MKHDLYLRYEFTDRAGRDVYDIFTDEDRLLQKNKLGEMRIPPGNIEVEPNYNQDKEGTWMEVVARHSRHGTG